MQNKILLCCSLMLGSATVCAQQSILNGVQALEGAQAVTGAATNPSGSLTNQLENVVEQNMLQSAPQGVQNAIQAGSVLNGVTNSPTGIASGLGSALAQPGYAPANPAVGAGSTSVAPTNPDAATQQLEGAIVQKVTEKALGGF